MKERTLVICDDDKEYISRLGRYISGRSDANISVACFSDRDSFREHAQANQIDAFLAGRNWISEELGADRKRWLLLAEERAEGQTVRSLGSDGYRQVYRYQAADHILDEVLRSMTLPGVGMADFPLSAEFTAVYAPAGWTEMTGLALALARHLGREGPAVYVGLNEFSPVMRLTARCKGYDMSDVAYCWRRGRLDYEQLERMTSHLDGLDCIPAPVNPAELGELSGEELEEILEAVCAVGGYVHTVVDFGGSISGRHVLFERCSRNIVLFPETETGQLQREEFQHFWETVGADGLLSHTICALLPLEELKSSRKGRSEDYLDELAKQLLCGGGEVETAGGVSVCGSDRATGFLQRAGGS